MNYNRPISRLASSALLSAGLFVAGSVVGTAPASADPPRPQHPTMAIVSAPTIKTFNSEAIRQAKTMNAASDAKSAAKSAKSWLTWLLEAIRS